MKVENFDSARASNTLAGNTQENSMRVLVDWVSCSFVLGTDFPNIFNLIGISDFSKVEIIDGARYEFAGYNKTYRLGKIDLMYDEENFKWLLNMSGQGCRQFEISSSLNIVTLFAILKNVNATYNRLDIAIDDFEKIYQVSTIRNAVYNKQCVTKLRVWGTSEKGLIATGRDDLIMDNFYLGDSSSRYIINVYDKYLEQLNKNQNKRDHLLDKVETWTRTEVRFKNDYAQLFVDHILSGHENLGYYIKSFLNEKIQFLIPSVAKSTTNRSRDAKNRDNITKWWKKFVNNAGKLHLSMAYPERTLEDTKVWLNKQVSTSLAMLHMYDPENYGDFVRSLTFEGLKKMKKKHDVKVSNQLYLDEQKKKKTTLKE